ncbi:MULTISPECIES: helix-turn-helix transcriptional regulator [unclassified Microbacterium]|uniref:helix-turn-helix transcriptional regulator n=1 Tax=unclassified Microbacterium TaxID=2609290 RepID=UPI003017A6A8
MLREQRLEVVLRAVVTVRPSEDPLLRRALADAVPGDEAFVAALRAFVDLCAGQGTDGEAAAVALDAVDPSDVDALALARAVAGWARAAWPAVARVHRDPLQDAAADPRPLGRRMRRPLELLLIEAALGCSRLDLAAEFAAHCDPDDPVGFDGPDDPVRALLRCILARVRLFGGDVVAAEAFARAAERTPGLPPLMHAFAAACVALVDSNADQRAAMREALRELATVDAPPTHLLVSGIHVIGAYAANAQNDVRTAARFVLRAGVDARLSNLRVVDRALCGEILVRAALDDRDLDAARAWHEELSVLVDHPIADTVMDRIASRIAHAEGDDARAAALAERSVARAIDRRRVVEATEGEILAARARIAAGEVAESVRRLTAVVEASEGAGRDVVRAMAARELRRTGRRLPPDRRRAWNGLSDREREVAVLLARGDSNADIAAALFISPHTVRGHVSRILFAFGTPTRAGVASALAGTGDPAGAAPPSGTAALTPRQRQVAELVASGASNREIATLLGIGEFTVEKHVGAILQRWDIASRAAIGAILLRDGPPDGR